MQHDIFLISGRQWLILNILWNILDSKKIEEIELYSDYLLGPSETFSATKNNSNNSELRDSDRLIVLMKFRDLIRFSGLFSTPEQALTLKKTFADFL